MNGANFNSTPFFWTRDRCPPVCGHTLLSALVTLSTNLTLSLVTIISVGCSRSILEYLIGFLHSFIHLFSHRSLPAREACTRFSVKRHPLYCWPSWRHTNCELYTLPWVGSTHEVGADHRRAWVLCAQSNLRWGPQVPKNSLVSRFWSETGLVLNFKCTAQWTSSLPGTS